VERVALEAAWEQVDYLSLHYYADNHADDTPSYLAMGAQFEDQLDTFAATLRFVKVRGLMIFAS
jgi:alpha-L-arabinofuranosidase